VKDLILRNRKIYYIASNLTPAILLAFKKNHENPASNH